MIPFVDLKASLHPIKDDLQKEFDKIFSTMNLSPGENNRIFEEMFAKFCETKHSTGVGSGTDALVIALKACGVKQGDEVITVSNSFIATVEAVCHVGAVPVFVDIEEESFLMDVSRVEEAITKKTKAIIPVHLYGQIVDMDPLLEIAGKYGLKVIEDACQAHGALYKNKKAGSIGDAGCFSFYFSKNLGAFGEGGSITTQDDSLVSDAVKLKNHGRTSSCVHEVMGYNSRMDELQAAVLRLKLPHLNKNNSLRLRLAQHYTELLEYNSNIFCPRILPDRKHVFHLYVIKTEKRDQLGEYLREHGVSTGIHYPVPIHRQLAYSKLQDSSEFHLPVTEKLAGKILSLPIYPELRIEDVEKITDLIKKFTGK